MAVKTLISSNGYEPGTSAARGLSLEVLSAFSMSDEHYDGGQPAALQFLQGLTSERVEGKRQARLSITHEFGRVEPKLDVCESREPTTHDLITQRRISSASKVATKCRELCDVERQRLLSCAISTVIRN